MTACISSMGFLLLFRPTLRTRPNKTGLNVRLSVRPQIFFTDFNEILCADRGR